MTETAFKFRIVFATTSRSEYFQMRPLIFKMMEAPDFEPSVLVGGAHLSDDHGRTLAAIEADDVPIAGRLETLVPGDAKLDAAISASRTTAEFARALDRLRPDWLFVFGDRYEHLALALAARCLSIAIAHIHGGEITEGSEDERFRHAITKLSDLHFVSTEVYAARIRQMGEMPDRVRTVGATFVELVKQTEKLDRPNLAKSLDHALPSPLALIAYHPCLDDGATHGDVMRNLLEAVAPHTASMVISGPNQDPGYKAVEEAARSFLPSHPTACYFPQLGSQRFQSLLDQADVMVGNSSAALHEAAYYGLPVVNAGSRQRGRLMARHVVNCDATRQGIEGAVKQALSSEFRNGLIGMGMPFGDGESSQRIIDTLRMCGAEFQRSVSKQFMDTKAVQDAVSDWGHLYG